ncbi:MAG: AAA family ATPase [Methanosarcinaceae archaeon]|nr:AAA family ATPase [Methanosarcinaceae archaeon]
MNDLWTVKYRPERLDGILGNEGSISTIKHLVHANNLPHLVLHGPRNSGKSSTVFALAYELYGKDYERNLTYFNASDFFDQGKRYLVRDKRFIHFLGTDDPKKIRTSVISIFKELVNEYAGIGSLDADYKLIFIDNAESLNTNAQHALRRIMERYTRTCRFILSTTQPSKLIAPLRSRGLQLFFTFVAHDELRSHLHHVAEQEGISVSDDALDALVYHSRGNVGNALLTMQYGSLQYPDSSITAEIIYEASLAEVPEGISMLYGSAKKHDLTESIKTIDRLLIRDGMSGCEVIRYLYGMVTRSNGPDKEIARLVLKLADADYRIMDAANDRIHLEALVTEMA